MMDIIVRLGALREQTAVRLLNLLAAHNAEVIREQPRLPLLYDSGVVYRRERIEVWSDYPTLLNAGHEDCDALSAAQAGLLLARGYRALRPGDPGHELAQTLKPPSIPALVMMTTRTRPGEPGMYHCILRYQIGGTVFRDDPSARLGMIGGAVDAFVLDRWRAARVHARAPLET